MRREMSFPLVRYLDDEVAGILLDDDDRLGAVCVGGVAIFDFEFTIGSGD